MVYVFTHFRSKKNLRKKSRDRFEFRGPFDYRPAPQRIATVGCNTPHSHTRTHAQPGTTPSPRQPSSHRLTSPRRIDLPAGPLSRNPLNGPPRKQFTARRLASCLLRNTRQKNPVTIESRPNGAHVKISRPNVRPERLDQQMAPLIDRASHVARGWCAPASLMPAPPGHFLRGPTPPIDGADPRWRAGRPTRRPAMHPRDTAHVRDEHDASQTLITHTHTRTHTHARGHWAE